MPKKNILLAMFDIKPKNLPAGLVLAQIKKELDLQAGKKLTEVSGPKTVIEMPSVAPVDAYWEELIAKLPQRPDFPLKYELITLSKTAILKELEKAMREPVNMITELASVGGLVYQPSASKSRAKIIRRNKPQVFAPNGSVLSGEALENFWISVGVWPTSTPEFGEATVADEPEPGVTSVPADLVAHAHVHSPASREIEMWLENLQRNRQLLSSPSAKSQEKPHAIFRVKPKWSSWLRFNRRAMVYFLAIALSGVVIFGSTGRWGITAKNNIVQNGNNAVANLEDAKHELENLNFIRAADSFALAYDDLNKASNTLSQLGASFLSVFGNLPGLNKVKAANNIVEAGQSLSKAGENLSLAFGTLYKTNLFSFLDNKKAGSAGGVSISNLLREFKDILNFADKNINRADQLLADIDASLIPSDKQQLFLDFKDKVPEFQKYVGGAVAYSDFLLKLVGADGAKTYLVLLQNNSELRPTGGFPGTYALITFENGALKKIFVDDIYRADAGLKENIVPPIPLQHITPNWGMRDANWFADFPFSARKIIELYRLGGGVTVDGVLTITPDIIGSIFNVIGPIEMPDYGLTLSADNFLAALQNEVEYEADRSAPKQILSDLQPKFFEQLARQDKEHWLAIFKIMSEAVEQKHILAYFENSDLEKAAIENGLGGEIKYTGNDYLQVVFANVKGSKTDFVTDNSMNLEAEINDDGDLEHTLKINRVHNGGDSKYGFYNRDNSAYIKVYVPKGSVLEGIQGQSLTDYQPLIGYDDFGFKKDSDLEQIEASIKNPFTRVDVFEESDKTVFGFWLITKPKQTKSVTLQYQTPISLTDGKYDFLWQKQSGTGKDQINFSFKLPDGKKVINQSVGLETMGNKLILNSNLTEDRGVDIIFK